MITEPTLLVNKDIVSKNIEKIANKFRRQEITFRPHFKTHQTAEIGEKFKPYTDRITVSSIRMAEFFAEYGWSDISIAFPANPREKNQLFKLSERINLHLVTASALTADSLAKETGNPINWWIKIDTGNQRAGLGPEKGEEIISLAKKMSQNPGSIFKGILGHAGQTYHLNNPQKIREEELRAIHLMNAIKKKIEESLELDCLLSLGDTPGCSILEDWSGVDEVRPGNFVFYDLMQMELGSCKREEIAIAMACPIVEVDNSKNKAVIHGGAIHFGKEVHSKFRYGQLLESKNETSWDGFLDNSYLDSLSQEHGVVHFDPQYSSKFRVGELVHIHPVHSCLTVDCMRGYTIIPGQTEAMIYRSKK